MALDPRPSGMAAASAPSKPSKPLDWVWLARIRHPQGRKGEVFADILTDFPEKFAERKQLWLLADPSAPEGRNENSPGRQPWVSCRAEALSPRGATEITPKIQKRIGHVSDRADNSANKTGALAPAGKSDSSKWNS